MATQTTSLQDRIDQHSIFSYPAGERFSHRQEWQKLVELMMAFCGFDKKLRSRLDGQDRVALLEDEREMEQARVSDKKERVKKFDSIAFLTCMKSAVEHYDASLTIPFTSYFLTLYAREINHAANREHSRRNEGDHPLTRQEAALWKNLAKLCTQMHLDADNLPERYYRQMADILDSTPEQIKRLIRKCTLTRRIVSLDSQYQDDEGDQMEKYNYADPDALSIEEQLERTTEVMRAIAAAASLDAQEYPRLFFTTDVLGPMRADTPTVDPVTYCGLLEKQEALLWDKLFVQPYIEYLFVPPPTLDCTRNLLTARLEHPLQDRSIAEYKQVTPSAVSRQRKRYAERMQLLARELDFLDS